MDVPTLHRCWFGVPAFLEANVGMFCYVNYHYLATLSVLLYHTRGPNGFDEMIMVWNRRTPTIYSEAKINFDYLMR